MYTTVLRTLHQGGSWQWGCRKMNPATYIYITCAKSCRNKRVTTDGVRRSKSARNRKNDRYLGAPLEPVSTVGCRGHTLLTTGKGVLSAACEENVFVFSHWREKALDRMKNKCNL